MIKLFIIQNSIIFNLYNQIYEKKFEPIFIHKILNNFKFPIHLLSFQFLDKESSFILNIEKKKSHFYLQVIDHIDNKKYHEKYFRTKKDLFKFFGIE